MRKDEEVRVCPICGIPPNISRQTGAGGDEVFYAEHDNCKFGGGFGANKREACVGRWNFAVGSYLKTHKFCDKEYVEMYCDYISHKFRKRIEQEASEDAGTD